MAKRTHNSAGTNDEAAEPARGARTADVRLGDFAEDLGRILGSTQAKASAWLEQRRALLDSLTKVRDTAISYIEQLGGSEPAPRRRPGRPPNAAGPKTGAVKRKRTMSAEARAKIAAAQRLRWARQRKNKE